MYSIVSYALMHSAIQCRYDEFLRYDLLHNIKYKSINTPFVNTNSFNEY